MRIFVFGHINSGKSYFVNKLRLIFSKYEIFQTDGYRKKYGDCSELKEKIIQNKFVNDILYPSDGIIEFSGLENIANKIISKLATNSCIIFWIQEKPTICLNRLNTKNLKSIPYSKFKNVETFNSIISKLKINFMYLVIDSKIIMYDNDIQKFSEYYKMSNITDDLHTLNYNIGNNMNIHYDTIQKLLRRYICSHLYMITWNKRLKKLKEVVILK